MPLRLERFTQGLVHQFERLWAVMNFDMAHPDRCRFGFESVYLSRVRDAALGDVYGMVHRQARHVLAIGNTEQNNLQVNKRCLCAS
jgi:hypothetical protein